MYLFDTNIFLEFFLGQAKANSCEKVMGLVQENRVGWVTSFSMHAIEAIMGSKKRFRELSRFLEFFDKHPHFYCYATTPKEEMEICLLSLKVGLDFDDALQYYVAKKENLILTTLDRDFKKIKDVEVATPEEILAETCV